MNKKQARENLRQTKRDVCRQLVDLRHEHKLSVECLCYETGIPSRYLDKLECEMLEINLGYLNQIARCYDKKIKIELVDWLS